MYGDKWTAKKVVECLTGALAGPDVSENSLYRPLPPADLAEPELLIDETNVLEACNSALTGRFANLVPHLFLHCRVQAADRKAGRRIARARRAGDRTITLACAERNWARATHERRWRFAAQIVAHWLRLRASRRLSKFGNSASEKSGSLASEKSGEQPSPRA